MQTDLITLHEQAVLAHPRMLAFWDATAEQRFVLPHCQHCDRSHWYPRPHCPFCFSNAVQWRPAIGTGRIYAATQLRRETPPRIIAYITLTEGPLMLSNLIDCTLSEASIGRPVRVGFQTLASGRVLPVFRLNG